MSSFTYQGSYKIDNDIGLTETAKVYVNKDYPFEEMAEGQQNIFQIQHHQVLRQLLLQ